MGARWLCWLGLLAACSPPPVAHEASMFFGDVALGQSRSVALTLTNPAAQAQVLTFQIVEGDFHLDEFTRTLRANETATLLVRFTPEDLGPRTGRLAINGTELALDGRGTGGRISASAQLVAGPFALVSGQPEQVEHAVLLLRNTGTAGSSLELGPPRADGSEVCIGDFVGATCTPWVPPASLDTQTMLQVPLAFRVTAPGARRWQLVFPSNDFLRPELTVEVLALVEALEPCVFTPPSEVVLIGGGGVLRLTHTGPGTCLLRELTLSPAVSLAFSGAPRLPLHLESGASFAVSIGVRPLAPLQLVGSVHVVAVGTAPLDIPVRREIPPGNCLAIVPETIDFGTPAQGCNSANRNVQLYNACASPLTIAALSLTEAGEPPGTPGCPGSATCPEFFIVTGLSAGTVVNPGSTPATFSVKYRPAGIGADTAAVRVTTREGAEAVIALQGSGAPLPSTVDTFRQDTRPKADVLVMVDASPSFVPKRAAVRTNLQAIVGGNHHCADVRWAFAAADGAPDAGVELLRNDAGERWTSSDEPDFVNRALFAFDSLPVGSEVEACIGPAADLVQDAGLRTGSSFGGVCITDALEQSPNPTSALQVFQALPTTASWSTITGIETSTCAVEAIDDGVHQALVNASYGSRADICDPSWGSQFVSLGLSCFGYRTTFFLTSRPAGALVLALDGQPVPSADWTYDATNNAVSFVPGKVPAPGQTLTVSYSVSCTP